MKKRKKPAKAVRKVSMRRSRKRRNTAGLGDGVATTRTVTRLVGAAAGAMLGTAVGGGIGAGIGSVAGLLGAEAISK